MRGDITPRSPLNNGWRTVAKRVYGSIICGMPFRVRRYDFIHNKMWIGLLPVCAGAFGSVTLLYIFAGTAPAAAVSRGLVGAALCIFGYVLGIWASTGEAYRKGDTAERTAEASRPRWMKVAGWVLLLFALSAPSALRIMDGSRTLREGVAETVCKMLSVVCLIVPVKLSRK